MFNDKVCDYLEETYDPRMTPMLNNNRVSKSR